MMADPISREQPEPANGPKQILAALGIIRLWLNSRVGPMDLSGKTVLITGSTDGVGRALMTTAFLPSMRYTRQAGVLWFDISC
jgi:hypothetical protein